MNQFLRCSVVVLAVAGALSESPVRAGDEVDLSGKYTGEGGSSNPNDTWTVSLEIRKKGDIYEILYGEPKAPSWIAVGIVKEGLLSVAWKRPNGQGLGVSVYKIEKGEKGPRLDGKWTDFGGNGKLGWEKLNYALPIK